MTPTLIKELLKTKPEGQIVKVYGWVRTIRESKNLTFIQVNDGSALSSLQLTLDKNAYPPNSPCLEKKEKEKSFTPSSLEKITKTLTVLTTGSSIFATGLLVKSLGAGQSVEVLLTSLEVLGECSPDTYPLQKKKMSMEYLRENAHLRARTNTFGAVYRIRNSLSFAVHSFFQERGFLYIHTPIITCSDCEGAGQMFQVTTLPLEKIANSAPGPIDYKKDFFGKKAGLTVSGQLEAETIACALGRVYTFGPTFRAENSNTPRHLSEFWMIEPEMAFYDLTDNMDIQEEFIKYLVSWVLKNDYEDLTFFDTRIRKGTIKMLEAVATSTFKRLPYTEAIKILEANNEHFEFKVKWGADIATEHERYLTESVFKCPVMCYNYPKEIKSFYMKQNPDGKTVKAVDVLVPGIGEIIGGSEREEDYNKLLSECKARKMDMSNYEWYLDLRRFGSVPHSGFGLGFERLIRYVTGMENIRDVILYPRAPRLASF